MSKHRIEIDGIRAPRGWAFGRDDLGIYVVRVRKRGAVYPYHLTSDDVRGGVAAIRAAGIRHETSVRQLPHGNWPRR